MSCNDGCEKSEYRQTNETYSEASSSTTSESGNVLWVEPRNQKSKKCNKCRYPKDKCRCRHTNIKILKYLPPGAIPISTPNSICSCRRSGCGGCQPKPYEPMMCSTGCGQVCQSKNGRVSMQVPVNPLTELLGLDSNLNNGYIMVQMQCNPGGVVTFQWESFQGIIGANNIKEVTMNATLGSLPIYSVEFPIRILLAGDYHTGYFGVKNTNGAKVYQFHFKNTDDLNARIGDSITIYGSCVTWLTCP